jgi:DNA-binding protein
MKDVKVINKVDIAIIAISRDLLCLGLGEKVKSVKEYSDILEISVGSVQKAFDKLESEKVIVLDKKGVLGKVLISKDKNKLISHSELKSVVGVMPLPYSKRYEGLATAIKTAFENFGINFYFAYMQGSRIRLKMLKENIYDFAIMSELAYINFKTDKIKKVIDFGNSSYVSKHILISNENDNGKIRIGIDKNSEDQYFLSKRYFKNYDYEFININSDNVLREILSNNIDKAIISFDDIEDKELENASIIDLEDKEYVDKATIASIVINSNDKFIESLLLQILDKYNIKSIQNKVINKIMIPRY